MDIDDDLEARHTHKGPAFLRDACFENGVELFPNILQLILKQGFRENIIRAEHFGSLLAQHAFITADLLAHQFQYFAIHLLGRDVAEEAVVIYHIAWFITYISCSCRLFVLVHDQTGEKRFDVSC